MELEGENGIFMKIVRREVPAEIVYEDEDTLAFLDITPVSRGHTLVIPKNPVRNVFSTDEKTWATVMATVHKLAPIVRDAVGAKGVHINSNHEPAAAQAVFHLHVHIIPRHSREGYEFWPTDKEAEETLQETAEAIRRRLS